MGIQSRRFPAHRTALRQRAVAAGARVHRPRTDRANGGAHQRILRVTQGAQRVATTKVPFVDLGRQYEGLRSEILQTIDTVLKSGHYILGPEVDAFEREAADFVGVKHAIGMANGSDSLWLSLKCLGVGPGDEVITAPNSFIASAWAIAAAGATPVFSDVDETFNLDPHKLAQAITPRTRAIMPVHLTGRIADMDAITAVAARHKLPVIEDAAQAIGATRGGRRAGTFGAVGSFSLHPLKNLAAFGDGGL